MRKMVIADSDKCVNCGICELICSAFKDKVFNPRIARIWVVSNVADWLEGEADRPFEVEVCRQCPGISPCMTACPVEAITREPKTGAVVVNDELCTRCEKCVEACPYDAISYNQEEEKILKCDLCGGEPICVKYCPKGALQLKTLMEYQENPEGCI